MNKYNPAQIEKMLDSMIILYDSREKPGENLDKRLEGFKCPSNRFKLNVGDYTGKWLSVDCGWQEMSHIAVCERKQGLTEICNNFTKDRERFKREFERAKEDGCKVHLIIEEDNYEKLFAHKYRSKLLPQSLIASLLSWQARYGYQIHFCKAETSGRLIHDILHYELREWLLNQ